MSAWRDRLGPASFRGVPFFVESSERTGGRRGVDQEFPFRDDAPYVEDLGRKGRTFPLEGFVIGSDYMSDRDALIDALEAEGPGELVHPYYGTIRVSAGSFRVRETTNEGGMARFSFEFRETSTAPAQPTVSVDAPAALVATAAAARAAAGAEFLAKFNALSTLKASVTAGIRTVSGAVGSVLATIDAGGQELAALAGQVNGLTSQAAGLASAPVGLVASLVATFEGLGSGLRLSVEANAYAVMLGLYLLNIGDRPPATTPARVIERQNFDALQALVQRLVLIEASVIAVAQTFDSYEDAVIARTSITDLMDAHAYATADDFYPTLQEIRGDLVTAVPGDALELPHLISYTPRAVVPSLVLAHRLYGNLEREQDLIARNKIANPGIIAGGMKLEVLSG